MKKSELTKLVQEYHTLQAKLAKKYDHKISERIKDLEHRYYHETGDPSVIKSLKNPIPLQPSTCEKFTIS